MPYEIIRYNGAPLVVVNDGTINTSATSLQLVGKGVATYGEAIAEDLVHLLEHCTSPTEPTNPIVGQVWNHLDAGGTGVHILKVCKSEAPVVWDAIIQASGGTMTGSLMLAHDPVQPLEAATKRYIDARSNFTGLLDVPQSYTAGGAGPGWVPIINSTMTGLEWGLAAGTGGGTVGDLVIDHHGGGGGIATVANDLLITVENFTGTGSQTAFTLVSTIGSQTRVNVFIDGLYQDKNTYSLSGTTLTFTTAPTTGVTIEVEIISVVNQGTTTLASNSTLNVNIDRFTGNGSTVAYTLTQPSSLNFTNVFVDGVYQDKDTYTVSGTTLTFTQAPPNNSVIEIEELSITGTAGDTLNISIDRFTSSGTNYTLLGSSTLNNTDVYISGLYQDKSTYTVSGTTLTLSTAPINGLSIEVVRHSFVAGTSGASISVEVKHVPLISRSCLTDSPAFNLAAISII